MKDIAEFERAYNAVFGAFATFTERTRMAADYGEGTLKTSGLSRSLLLEEGKKVEREANAAADEIRQFIHGSRALIVKLAAFSGKTSLAPDAPPLFFLWLRIGDSAFSGHSSFEDVAVNLAAADFLPPFTARDDGMFFHDRSRCAHRKFQIFWGPPEGAWHRKSLEPDDIATINARTAYYLDKARELDRAASES